LAAALLAVLHFGTGQSSEDFALGQLRADRDCADFSSHVPMFFQSRGPSDANRLNPDGEGIGCETTRTQRFLLKTAND
jgi:hypothetical protein